MLNVLARNAASIVTEEAGESGADMEFSVVRSGGTAEAHHVERQSGVPRIATYARSAAKYGATPESGLAWPPPAAPSDRPSRARVLAGLRGVKVLVRRIAGAASPNRVPLGGGPLSSKRLGSGRSRWLRGDQRRGKRCGGSAGGTGNTRTPSRRGVPSLHLFWLSSARPDGRRVNDGDRRAVPAQRDQGPVRPRPVRQLPDRPGRR